MSPQSLHATQSSPETLNASGVLLRELIDYAGLFPPASLSMAQSAANYDAYLESRWNWILGRFIVSVARLEEFEQAWAALPVSAEKKVSNWRLSVLIGADV